MSTRHTTTTPTAATYTTPVRLDPKNGIDQEVGELLIQLSTPPKKDVDPRSNHANLQLGDVTKTLFGDVNSVQSSSPPFEFEPYASLLPLEITFTNQHIRPLCLLLDPILTCLQASDHIMSHIHTERRPYYTFDPNVGLHFTLRYIYSDIHITNDNLTDSSRCSKSFLYYLVYVVEHSKPTEFSFDGLELIRLASILQLESTIVGLQPLTIFENPATGQSASMHYLPTRRKRDLLSLESAPATKPHRKKMKWTSHSIIVSNGVESPANAADIPPTDAPSNPCLSPTAEDSSSKSPPPPAADTVITADTLEQIEVNFLALSLCFITRWAI